MSGVSRPMAGVSGQGVTYRNQETRCINLRGMHRSLLNHTIMKSMCSFSSKAQQIFIHAKQQIKQGQQTRTHEKQIKLQLNGNDNHSYIPQSQKFPNIQDTIRCFIPSNKSIYPLEHFTFLLKMFSAILQQQGLGYKKLHELEGIALSFSSSQEKQPSKQHLFIDIFFFTKIRVIRSSVLSPDQLLSPPMGNKQTSAPGNCYLHGQPNQHPFGQFILRRCVICASSVLVP